MPKLIKDNWGRVVSMLTAFAMVGAFAAGYAVTNEKVLQGEKARSAMCDKMASIEATHEKDLVKFENKIDKANSAINEANKNIHIMMGHFGLR